jgi:ABC-2 type transport system permease protein
MMGSMWDIADKQLRDNFSSKKFLLVLGLFMIFSMASIYIGAEDYQQQMEQYRDGSIGYQPEKPDLMDVFTPMMSFNMPLAAGLLALLLSYNAISREREEGTIELLLSYPVYRDEVINGKFMAGFVTVATALVLAFTASSGLAIYMLELMPTAEQISRLVFMGFGTLIYMGFFLGLGTLLSTVFRSSWRSLIVGAVLLGFFLAVPFGAQALSGVIYQYEDTDPGTPGGPGVARSMAVEGGEDVEVRPEPDRDREEERRERQQVQEKRERFVQTVSRLSPSTSYGNYVETMLGINYESSTGLEPTLRESLESAFGYLVYLVSQTALIFTASYAVFLRQDL